MKRILKIIGILLIVYFFLAYAFPKFIAVPFAAWNSQQVWKEVEKEHLETQLVDNEIIGVYEYQAENKEENHSIFIDIVDNKLVGFYFGTEDGSGHGIFHYGNPLLNFKLTEKEIAFEIGQRELFETTRNKVYKADEKPKKEIAIGISKSPLKYSGQLTELGFELNCESEFNDCWENKMEFKKVYDL
ncbi:hypothetical protein [Winogradskyella sediminis]|uniref:hypothetical protein n=1 Tax=Winogradskyella sediminis TaxID=1382466 RepID=UPI000E23EAC7|nr:hypothetical protein [Winogradskyella sediminis]REG86289.1 hypothetical protein C8N41_103387 [Winogradskyella sediminis]